MILIKRYPNRKLYNTVSKSYVTLSEIADLIQKNEDVQVVDSVSGKDLTNLILSQIVLEQEKNNSGRLPRSILASLIRSASNQRGELLRTLGLSLGLGHFIDEEIRRRLAILVKYNEITSEEVEYLSQKLLSPAYFHEDSIQKSLLSDLALLLERLMRELGLPSRDEIKEMMAELDRLTELIDNLSE